MPNGPNIISTADGVAATSTAFSSILLTVFPSTVTLVVNILQ